MTSILNLYEVHYAQISRGVPDEEARDNLAPFEGGALAPEWAALREASIFRLEMRQRGLSCSYVDAAGFVLARRAGLPFLTGDAAFESVEGVEFLKERSPSATARRRKRST